MIWVCKKTVTPVNRGILPSIATRIHPCQFDYIVIGFIFEKPFTVVDQMRKKRHEKNHVDKVPTRRQLFPGSLQPVSFLRRDSVPCLSEA